MSCFEYDFYIIFQFCMSKFQEIMKAEYRQENEQFYESQGWLL